MLVELGVGSMRAFDELGTHIQLGPMDQLSKYIALSAGRFPSLRLHFPCLRARSGLLVGPAVCVN